jgi:hypothetical protein
MEGSRNMVAVSFALIVVIIYLVACMYVVNPFLRKQFIVLDDYVALYIDTMASVEKGSVEIPIEEGTVNRFEIAYRNKDKEEEIPEDGWYVIVTYKLPERKSASRINTYPEGANLDTRIFSPSVLCVVKEQGSEYPRVKKC